MASGESWVRLLPVYSSSSPTPSMRTALLLGRNPPNPKPPLDWASVRAENEGLAGKGCGAGAAKKREVLFGVGNAPTPSRSMVSTDEVWRRWEEDVVAGRSNV